MSIGLICASAYAYPDRSVTRVDKLFPIIRTSRQPRRFFKFPNQNSQAKQTLSVTVSTRRGGDSIFSGKWRKTGLGGCGSGGGVGGGSGGGKGEGEGEGGERFDRIKVVPMLGLPETARELESLLKQLGGYELIVKWLVFRLLKLQKGVFKDRWLVDEHMFLAQLLIGEHMFLAQLLIGYGLWLFGKVMARVAVTRLSCYLPAPTTVSLGLPIGFSAGILNACAFQVMGIVTDIMLSFIPAPTSLSRRPPVGVDARSIAPILFVCLCSISEQCGKLVHQRKCSPLKLRVGPSPLTNNQISCITEDN